MQKQNLFIGTMLLLVMFGVGSCGNKKEMVTTENFGSFDGKEVSLYTLTNNQGNVVKLTNYGAAIVEVNVPDRDGNKANVTFGYDNLEGYVNGDPYFGKVVGQLQTVLPGGNSHLRELIIPSR